MEAPPSPHCSSMEGSLICARLDGKQEGEQIKLWAKCTSRCPCENNTDLKTQGSSSRRGRLCRAPENPLAAHKRLHSENRSRLGSACGGVPGSTVKSQCHPSNPA